MCPIDVGPDGTLEGFVGVAIFMLQVREEKVFGVARDLRVRVEKGGELGIVAGYIFLVA